VSITPHVDTLLVTVEVPFPVAEGDFIPVPWPELRERLEQLRGIEGVTLGRERLVVGIAVEALPDVEIESRFVG
jgi:hypothetical protein